MPEIPFTTFVGRHAFTTKDRDGYTEAVFDIHILLRFYADGTVHAVEKDEECYTGDEDISTQHDLEGCWETTSDKLIYFGLKRLHPPKKRNNEIPGDGSNYYTYPTVADVAYLSDKDYVAVYADRQLALLGPGEDTGQPFMLDLLGKKHRNFKGYRSLPKLKNPKLWATFRYGPYTETQQWTSEDEPHEVSSGFCLRMHSENNRVEVVAISKSPKYDLFSYKSVTLEGTWEYKPNQGYLLDLNKSEPRESVYRLEIKDAQYWANFYNGRLCLEPIRDAPGDRGSEEPFYDLIPIDRASVWLPSVDKDPLAKLRAQLEQERRKASEAWTQSLQRPEAKSTARPETSSRPAAPKDESEERPTKKIWEQPAWVYTLSSAFWIVVILLLLKFFG